MISDFMVGMTIRLWMMCCVLFVFTFAGSAQSPVSSEDVVKKFTAAFNDHNVNDMIAHIANDIEWFSVLEDSLGTEVKGSEALRRWLVGYFQSLPSARSEIEGIVTSGSYVATRERATWTGKNGERTQVAIGVYEVRDGKIVRVWYFPSEKSEKK